MVRHAVLAAFTVVAVVGCGAESSATTDRSVDVGSVDVGSADVDPAKPKTVGYDLRRLRPHDGESLSKMFERLRKAAIDDGKSAAVLFSADWCEPCRLLDLEFGNMHPADEIGHVRILEIKEEDWEAATRMNEVNALRTRWTSTINAYPVLLLLDDKGDRIEEMQEAKDRLTHEGLKATIPAWFAAVKR
ncbi:MAG: hypothetical protein JKY37_17600 [Nannocystaceae bacterium]|nr:hypothetical protein [Nannocystaceae bacterium]